MKYLGYGMIAGFLGVFVGVIALFTATAAFAPNSEPAPAISRLVHLDEKLRFLRRHPELSPKILAVGSSVTWRQLSGQALVPLAGEPHRFLNGATGYLQVHQTWALIRFYLTHFRQVQTVLVMVSLPDFRNCTTNPQYMFEPEEATRYAFEGWPAIYFLLRHFSPGRYVKTAMTLADRRTPFTGDLYLDTYGSGPIELPASTERGLRYGELDADPACVDALIGLTREMRDRGIHLALVFAPIHPDYRARYPQAIRWLEQVISRLRTEQRQGPENLTVLNMFRSPFFAEKDFYDAFHLQWTAVKDLSARVARKIVSPSPAPMQDRLLSESE